MKKYLIIKNDEQKEYEKYAKVRSKFMFKQIYDLLHDDNEKIEYKIISSYIRYDKNLKYIIYKYMATSEEYLRSLIFEKYDALDKEYNDIEKLKKDLTESNNTYSYLYYNLKLFYPDLIKFCSCNRLIDINEDDIKLVRNLRNDTMHHNCLLFGKCRNTNDLPDHLDNLVNALNVFKKLLPNDYWKGFTKEIVNLKRSFNSYYIKVKDGTFCYEKRNQKTQKIIYSFNKKSAKRAEK